MTASRTTTKTTTPSSITAYGSIIVPGLGQFLAGKRGRGLMIFLTTAVLAFIINWAFGHQNIGKITLGSVSASWLWLPLILFWIWNILDAGAAGRFKAIGLAPGLLCVAVILYVIAWSFTDVRLGRLVERFDAARQVSAKLLNPDVVTISIGGQDQICTWECLSKYASDKFSGRTPEGVIRWSDNLLDIVGRVKPMKAPAWQVRLGLAEPDSKVNTFVAGSMIETIAMGLMATIFSTILAVPVSFMAARNIMSHVPGGTVMYYVSRTVLNVVRAIDTIVWGLVVIVWVGLGSFAGVMALTIHGIAALGKLFSEEIEHIDPGPVEAVTATGANLIQTIRFAVIPQIIPSFLSYSLLRWDINMRSATVIGFVAGGGIGFFVIETVRMGGYQQYATALWAVAIVIVIVDYVSERMRTRILEDQPKADTRGVRPALRTLRTIFYVILGVAVFAYCWQITELSIRGLMSPGKNFGRLILDFLKIDLSPEIFKVVFQQMLVKIGRASC